MGLDTGNGPPVTSRAGLEGFPRRIREANLAVLQSAEDFDTDSWTNEGFRGHLDW